MILLKSHRILWGTLLLILGLAAAGRSEDWRWNQQPGEWLALTRGEVVVWRFLFGPDEPKPHFHPVALPDGRVLTCDRPPDHIWHHGLWFAWKYLNGVNYWEPDPRTGKPQGATEWSNVELEPRPDYSARITMDLRYRPPGQAVVLAEQRTVEVSAPDADGRYHFDWTSTFTAGETDVVLDRTPLPGEPGGQPWGGYAGLSIRLANDLDQRAADTTVGSVPFDQGRYRGRATAMDYHGLIDGRPGGIAVCDHPANLNHPSPWYAIRSEPMGYFSPAVICFGPHTLPAGQSLTLRYRVIVHPGRWDARQLNEEYGRFAAGR